MSNIIEYKDLIAFHPGSYIEEIVEDLNITQAEFANRLGVSAKLVSKLINGEENISDSTANKLAKLTGISMQSWLNIQASYSAKMADIENQKNIDEQNIEEQKVCNYIDFSYLKKNNFIENKRYSIQDKIKELRKLLNYSNLSKLFEFNSSVSYRRSESKNEEKSIVCSNVMLELAANKARNKTSNKFNKSKLDQKLDTIKSMTVQDPKDFYPKLKDTLLDCGIVLEAFPNLPGARLNGAIKKFKNGSILLLITDKNKYSDIFWFSFVHELGHIYHEDFYSNYKDMEKYNLKEKQADKFAENFFIPKNKYHKFLQKKTFNVDSIKNFSEELNISPGIIVGRLQSDGYIEHCYFNELKTEYKISLNKATS
ncbi:HigA family addiction module antidote protein [Lactobacillus sp. M0398]|uniref:HigA family addiction module antitoxin n=1 Tax=unclassified Lactobacillus TaxID=2620435 RepID=UPI0018DDF161|nr:MULTISPECIES: HigA family addiction module antitoxin [unclassified Lactobacillus]MBI0121307.1 HigA family addiction module antidote protein [Lactobacillus sp. M0398]MBI0123454.1 HigA family addiction module antidote protein [Lactobacillus sp. W8174]MBI0135481.1 HigA family addiction module antidote protein [Lactobacillus sp. W8173]